MKFKNIESPKKVKEPRVIGGIKVKYHGEEYTAFEAEGKEFKVKGGKILAAFKQAEAYKRKLDKGRLDKAKLHGGKRQTTTPTRTSAVVKSKAVHDGRKQKRKAQ